MTFPSQAVPWAQPESGDPAAPRRSLEWPLGSSAVSRPVALLCLKDVLPEAWALVPRRPVSIFYLLRPPNPPPPPPHPPCPRVGVASLLGAEGSGLAQDGMCCPQPTCLRLASPYQRPGASGPGPWGCPVP